MPRRSFTAAEKAALAQGWAVARADGETQEAYASRHGTTARRIREFVAEFGAPLDVDGEARRIVDEAMAKLRRLEQRIRDANIRNRAADGPVPPLPAPPAPPSKLAVVGSGAPPGATRKTTFQWDLD